MRSIFKKRYRRLGVFITWEGAKVCLPDRGLGRFQLFLFCYNLDKQGSKFKSASLIGRQIYNTSYYCFHTRSSIEQSPSKIRFIKSPFPLYLSLPGWPPRFNLELVYTANSSASLNYSPEHAHVWLLLKGRLDVIAFMALNRNFTSYFSVAT
jgi:hypothetical protein